jgi:tripartite-type tricarboxylate transporter receptor subunit TctC
VAKLNADFGKILAQKDIQDRFLQQGAVASHDTPEAFHKLQVSEYERLSKMIKALGIRVQ